MSPYDIALVVVIIDSIVIAVVLLEGLIGDLCVKKYSTKQRGVDGNDPGEGVSRIQVGRFCPTYCRKVSSLLAGVLHRCNLPTTIRVHRVPDHSESDDHVWSD
jgi:hypothetical protein